MRHIGHRWHHDDDADEQARVADALEIAGLGPDADVDGMSVAEYELRNELLDLTYAMLRDHDAEVRGLL